jgi:hypothetical protein
MNSTFTNTSETFNSKIIGYYLVNTLNVLGSFLNIICILIFYKIIKQEQNNQGHLFKYLFLKSISDFLFCITNIPVIVYYRKEPILDDSFIMQLWYIVGYHYLFAVFTQMSIWFEIFALIDCFCLVSMKFQWHKSKLCFYLTSILSTLIFFVYYIPTNFDFKIVRIGNGGYKIDEFNIIFVHYYAATHTISRELFPICISIVVNTLILFYIRKATIHRQRIANMNPNSVNSQAHLMIARSIHAERNKTKMIIVTSCMHLFRLPIIFFNFEIFNFKSNHLLIDFCFLFLHLYFAIPVVSYVLFNKTFRKYFSNLFSFHKC